jgi:hypothetical protein
MTTEARPKQAHEQVLTMLKSSSDNVFNCFGEPEAIAVVVAWRGGLRELPAGLISGPQGEPMTPDKLLRLIEQLARMTGYAVSEFNKMVQQEGQRHERQGSERATEARPPYPGAAE